jgi:hypothetical protein
MRKRTVTASPANYDFAKAYSELVRLREDVKRIEKLSSPRLSQPTGRDMTKADQRTRNSLQS